MAGETKGQHNISQIKVIISTISSYGVQNLKPFIASFWAPLIGNGRLYFWRGLSASITFSRILKFGWKSSPLSLLCWRYFLLENMDHKSSTILSLNNRIFCIPFRTVTYMVFITMRFLVQANALESCLPLYSSFNLNICSTKSNFSEQMVHNLVFHGFNVNNELGRKWTDLTTQKIIWTNWGYAERWTEVLLPLGCNLTHVSLYRENSKCVR